jgi:hypothetical protein
MLAGCEQPSFTSEPGTPTTPIKVPVLEAEALPGAVLLSWDPVADVEEYRLYRKAGTDNLSIPLDLDASKGYYVDKVGFDNSLKDGGSYTYTLEAVARGYVPLTGAISEPKTVTATIPARTSTVVVKAPAEAAVTLNAYGTGSSSDPDKLEVYWETTKEELPLSYQVEYSYGDGETLPLFYQAASYPSSSSSAITGDIYAKRVAFPLLGGDSSVKITAKWDDNYYAPASIKKSYTGALPALSPVGSLSVNSPVVNGSLTLLWTAIAGATGYDVYKAEITSGGPPSDGSTSTSSLESNNTIIATYSLITGDTRQDANTVYFTDTGYDRAKKLLYIVIAKNDSARSSSPALYVRVPSEPSVTTPSSLAVSSFQDLVDDAWKVSVSWTREEGVTYTLYRAPVEFDGSTVTSVGPYTAIPAASLSEKDGKVIFIDTVEAGQLSYWQSYRYKVIATKDGASKENTKDLTTSPFSKFINESPSVSFTGVSYGQFKVKPGEPSYSAGLTYELYAAESDGTQLTSGWEEITGTADDNGYYTWTAPDTRKRYVFSQTTKAGATTLVNSNPSTPTSNPNAPKLAASSSSWSLSPVAFGQDAGNVVIRLVTLTAPLSPPANWWLENSTYQTLSGAKIYRSAEKNSTIMEKTSVATVLFNDTGAVIVYGPGISIPEWAFYIVLPKHNTIPETTAGLGTTETWYFGTEYNSGGTTSYTSSNRYVIRRTSTTATTVDNVY